MYSKLADTELIYQLNKKNAKVFEEVYDQYYDGLYSHALRVLESNALAADVLQETFIKLWQRSGSLAPDTNLGNWLHVCMRNRCIDMIRKEKTRKLHVDRMGCYQENSICCDSKLLLEELINAIEAEVSQLPKKTRTIFELSLKGQYKTREIAQITSFSMDTIQKQLKYVRRLLKKRFPLPVILASIVYLVIQKFRN